MDYVFGMSILLITIIISIATAIWVYRDAERLNFDLFSKVMWSIGTFLLWMIFLPIWLLTRPSIDLNGEFIYNQDSRKVLKSCALGCLFFLLFTINFIFGVGLFFVNKNDFSPSVSKITTENEEIKVDESKEVKNEESIKAIPAEAKKIVIKNEKVTRNQKDPLEKVKNKKIFNVVEQRWYTDSYGGRSIIGKIKNTSGKVQRNVAIEIYLYDKNKNRIDDTMDNIDLLQEGEVWKFKAPVINEKAKLYKIKKIYNL